jgi:uncharacterized phage protein (TIGR02218 family)
VTYPSVETSAQGGSPVEIYDFALGNETFRFTSGEESVVVETNTYLPLEISRSMMVISQEFESNVMTITVPAATPLVRKYIEVVPGQRGVLTIRRFHRTDNDDEFVTIFKGLIRSVSFTMVGLTAEIVVQPLTSALSRSVPRFVYSGVCNHILYDTGCTVSQNSYRFIGEVGSISGNIYSVTNLSVGRPNGWATGGFVYDANGIDYRLIIDHVADQITLLLPFQPTVAVGSELQVFAGCDHSVTTCGNKFSNVTNFGGFPFVPRDNIFQKGI